MFESPQGYTPSPRVIAQVDYGQVTAGTTIPHGGCMSPVITLKLTNQSGGGITMTATPNIEAGKFHGQILHVIVDKDATQNIVVQDAATLANSGLRLPAASLTLNARDTLPFVWDAEEAIWWVTFGSRVNNLP